VALAPCSPPGLGPYLFASCVQGPGSADVRAWRRLVRRYHLSGPALSNPTIGFLLYAIVSPVPLPSPCRARNIWPLGPRGGDQLTPAAFLRDVVFP
jgi:hypothetical protein